MRHDKRPKNISMLAQDEEATKSIYTKDALVCLEHRIKVILLVCFIRISMQMNSSNSVSTTYLSPRAVAFSVPNLISDTQRNTQETRSDSSVLKNSESVLGRGQASTEIPSAELLCRDLWLEFHALGTEMIITKAGR